MIEQYKEFDGRHKLAKEYDEVEAKGLNLPLLAYVKDSWHTTYKFPNGINASLLFMPFGTTTGIQTWNYEIYASDKSEKYRIFRPATKEDVDATLEQLCSGELTI